MTLELDWTPPAEWERIEVLDVHTGGEPFRVVTGGFPAIEGETILEKRRYVREEYDHLRTALMWEPRGHADMYGVLLVEPAHERADVGVLFTHNSGYSTMCGHGIIGLGKVLPEAGFGEPLHVETPAGLVTARPEWNGNEVARVAFENVPSFVLTREREVTVPGVGSVTVDVAFGGAFYAFLDASTVDCPLEPDNYGRIVDLGRRVKRAVADEVAVEHPVEDDLGFLYGVVFTDDSEPADSRNVTVFADGEVDRCPTGTGVSAHLALRHARGEPTGEFVVESIVGSTFAGRVVDTRKYHGYDAVVPEITGSAHVTGRNELLFDPADPFAHGFFLR